MSLPCRRTAWLVLLGFASLGAPNADAQLWRQFLPTGGSEASDVRVAQRPRAMDSDIGLTQEHGPWLVVAASFSGAGAEQQAEALAQELRSRYRLRAYLHEMSFKFGDESPGMGVDEYGAPVRRRFRRGNQVRELAVLVGDFPSIEDPDAQKTLDYVKTLEPKALDVEASETSQSMAHVRRFEDAVLAKLGKTRKRGPMAQAFLTRNPLLPREFFVPKGVDPFVAKMNEGVEHSLLECPGQYTVRVATFRGKTVLHPGGKDDEKAKSIWSRRKVEDDNPLIEAAENAHLLTEELRAAGWEAYEFHDRNESIVTIGSFAQVAQRLPDRRIQALPEVERIMRTFGAQYDTPADPLSGIGNDAINQRLVDQQEQQVQMRLNNQQGQIVPGLNPKHVKILKGRGRNARVERIIPLDPTPQAIEVPKPSISSVYAG